MLQSHKAITCLISQTLNLFIYLYFLSGERGGRKEGQELNFEGLEMQKSNIPTDRAQSVDGSFA